MKKYWMVITVAFLVGGVFGARAESFSPSIQMNPQDSLIVSLINGNQAKWRPIPNQEQAESGGGLSLLEPTFLQQPGNPVPDLDGPGIRQFYFVQGSRPRVTAGFLAFGLYLGDQLIDMATVTYLISPSYPSSGQITVQPQASAQTPRGNLWTFTLNDLQDGTGRFWNLVDTANVKMALPLLLRQQTPRPDRVLTYAVPQQSGAGLFVIKLTDAAGTVSQYAALTYVIP